MRRYQAVRDDGVDLASGHKPGFDLGATLALFPAIAWATAYGYQITFICGEVKRPQRNIVLGQVLAAVIPAVFLVWFSWGLVNVMGQDFLGAIAYIDNAEEGASLDAFTLSTGSNTYSMISLLTDNAGGGVLHRVGVHLLQPVMYAYILHRVQPCGVRVGHGQVGADVVH